VNSFYNIEIPPCRKMINFSDVKSLPIFGSDMELFHVGHTALSVMEQTTREKMIEYAWDTLLAPVIETVESENGVLSFAFQMVRVVIDE